MNITVRTLNTPARHSLAARLRLVLAGAIGTISGVAPHVLHHVGPVAGAAVVSGLTGTAVFGAIGLLFMVPSLIRLRRRFGTWVAPGVALLVFAALFTVSTVWIGPAIRGEEPTPAEHSPDHPAHSATETPATGTR